MIKIPLHSGKDVDFFWGGVVRHLGFEAREYRDL